MSMVVNSKTLKISNYKFEKLGCCAISSKVCFVRDDNSRLYVKAHSILINSISDFIQPKFGYSEYNDGSINYNSLLEKAKSDFGIRIYPPLSINSLMNEDLLVTLRDGNSWHELICRKIEIVGYPNPIVKVYSKPHLTLSSNTVNKYTIDSLHLTERMEELPKEYYWDNCISYQRYVIFSTELLYSVEAKGKIDIPLRRFTEYRETAWCPNEISFSQMILTIDFDKMIIYGNYSDVEELPGGRRTSNGWENKYLNRGVTYYKTFELIFDIHKFIENLPNCLGAINGFVQIKDTFNKAPYQKDIIINYKEPLTFKQINEVLQFETDGSEYIDYC